MRIMPAGRFLKKYMQSSYWEDTVFLVVADHDSRVTGAAGAH
ncbi:MAG: hypothetical protein R2875_16730 [Desulfobacterales bacterium]